MPSRRHSLFLNANRTTARFALYFSLDDPNLHTDAPSFLSLVTDLSLVAAAAEILPIVGHHLIERATDFVLDKAVSAASALKDKLLSRVHSESRSLSSVSGSTKDLSADSEQVIDLMIKALRQSHNPEVTRAVTAGQAAIAALVRSEFKLSEAKARDYSIEISHEIKVAVTKK